MVREKLCEILNEMEYFSGGGRVFESDEVIDELIKFIGWLSLECANGVCGDDCPIHTKKPNIKTLTPKQLEIYRDILTTSDNKIYGRGIGVTTVILRICEDFGLWRNIVDKYIGDSKMIRIIRDLRKDTVKESNSTPLEPLQNGEREDWISKRTKIISDMLDNPDKYGIYPTTKCFEELDKAVEELLSQSKKESYQSGCEDMLRDTCAKIALFIESESGKSGRKEILKFCEDLISNEKKE